MVQSLSPMGKKGHMGVRPALSGQSRQTLIRGLLDTLELTSKALPLTGKVTGLWHMRSYYRPLLLSFSDPKYWVDVELSDALAKKYGVKNAHRLPVDAHAYDGLDEDEHIPLVFTQKRPWFRKPYYAVSVDMANLRTTPPPPKPDDLPPPVLIKDGGWFGTTIWSYPIPKKT